MRMRTADSAYMDHRHYLAFEISDRVRHRPAGAATHTTSEIESRGILLLSKQ